MNPKPNILPKVFILTDREHKSAWPLTQGSRFCRRPRGLYPGTTTWTTWPRDRCSSKPPVAPRCHPRACTPSRMCLLTAMEPHRCAAWANHWIIFPEQVTWPGHFAEHGYATCLVGKMHFGGQGS